MNYTFRLFILAILVSCSTAQKNESPLKEVKPKWIYSPTEGCSPQTEICASGEGDSFEQSDLNATKSLASIFKTRIKSKFEIDKLNFTKDEVSSIQEKITDKVQAEVDVVLKSSFIKERYELNGIYFSLAVLDKRRAEKVIRLEIEKLDDELLHHFKLKNRLYLPKMLIAYNTRSELNERLIILSNKSIESPVTSSQIKMIKYLSLKNENVSVETDENLPESLKTKFEELLVNLNYKLVSKNSADFLIKISYSETDDYLNVEGFQKITYLVAVDTFDQKNNKLGGYSIKISTQGRTKRDSSLKMEEKVSAQFEENIDKLNLKN